jgi:hypothetical protein
LRVDGSIENHVHREIGESRGSMGDQKNPHREIRGIKEKS